MTKYRKKPVVIEAITFEEFVEYGKNHGANIVNGMPWSFEYNGHPVTNENDECYIIPTLEGPHLFTPLDMLITGVNGEIYPCKKDIFEKTYESAGNKSFMSVEVNLGDMPEFKTLINSLGKILTDERIPEEIRLEHYNECNDALEKFNIKN